MESYHRIWSINVKASACIDGAMISFWSTDALKRQLLQQIKLKLNQKRLMPTIRMCKMKEKQQSQHMGLDTIAYFIHFDIYYLLTAVVMLANIGGTHPSFVLFVFLLLLHLVCDKALTTTLLAHTLPMPIFHSMRFLILAILYILFLWSPNNMSNRV